MPELLMQSVFQGKVFDVPDTPESKHGLYVLKPAKNNGKLSGNRDGRFVRGPWRGKRLYSLTLEERATCPATCDQLMRCYGNRMRHAHRYRHGPALEAALAKDVAHLTAKYPEGVVVRLHVLGDFYSTAYVEHWGRLVRQYPALHVFGYTHREAGTPIGDAVTRLVQLSEGRVRILRSHGFSSEDPLPRAVVVPKGSTAPHPATDVLCPEQTGKTESCLTCGLCMNGRTRVSFLDHGVNAPSLVRLERRQEVA